MGIEDVRQNEDEINLIDYAIVLLKRKKLIVGIPLVCVAITLIISLVIPNIYRAETRILAPQEGNAGTAAQLLSQVGSGLSGFSGKLGVNNQSDLYVGMLQSRTVLDTIITRFDLKKRYEDKTFEDARKSLKEHIAAQIDPKSNIIVLAVEDKDPQQAADMANAFVEELRKLTKGLSITEAAQRRLFFEEQLKDTKESLIKVEESMKSFQERTGALHVDEQVKAVIKNVAQLRAEIAAKEVELRVVKTYATPHNPDLQRAEETLAGMKSELAKIESKSGASYDPLMPTGRMPSVGTDYIRRLRDLKFNETLYELLTKQYEAAKIDEARGAAVIQVIDRAIPPEKRERPKRTVMLVVAGAVSFLLSIVTVLLLDYRERISADPDNRQRIEQLKKYAELDDLRMLLTKKGVLRQLERFRS